MRAAAIVPAAGRGVRMRSRRPKVLLPLLGRALLAWTLDPIHASGLFSEILVAFPLGEKTFFSDCLGPLLDAPNVRLIPGGETRQESVAHCINELSGETEVVAIHDGARPLVTGRLLRETVEQAFQTGAAIAAVPCKDTVKVCDKRGIVKETLERDSLRLVQTPQCFRFDILKTAYDRARQEDFTGTDDSAIVERLGIEVHVVCGSYENIKVTTVHDLDICEEILRRRQSGEGRDRL